MHALHAKVTRPPQRLAYGQPHAPRRVAVAAIHRPVAGRSGTVGAARRRQKEQQRSARVRREAVQDVDVFGPTAGRGCSDWLPLSELKMLRGVLADLSGIYEIGGWDEDRGVFIPVYLGQTKNLWERLGRWRSLLAGSRPARTATERELASIRGTEASSFRIRFLECANPREVELGILRRFDYLLNKANNGQRRSVAGLFTRASPAVDC